MADSKSPRSNKAPYSSSAPQRPTGVSEALSEVRSYRDDAALDRVWNRLDTQRRRSPVVAPATRAAVAAALVAAGVFAGIVYERQRLGDARVAMVSSEVITAPEAPAGPVDEGPRFQAPSREAKEEERRKLRARSRVKRLSAPVLNSKSKDSLEENAAEVEAPAVEEVAPAPFKAEWVGLVERGEYASAYQQLEESGGFDAVLDQGTSEELMTLVEVARFVGQQGRAIQALRAVTERHQADANAPIAAMILGNLLSRSGDPKGAAAAYALNRRLSPGGDFAEDALVGEFDMALAAGDLARVERLRDQYEAEFPEGRHLESISAEALRLAERKPRSSSLGAVLGAAEKTAGNKPAGARAADDSLEESDEEAVDSSEEEAVEPGSPGEERAPAGAPE